MTLIAAAAALATTAGTGIAAAAPHSSRHHTAVRCTGTPTTSHRLHLTVDGVPTFGYYAVPRTKAKGIVVFDHGYGHTAADWQPNLERAAKTDHVIAVAMDYHGQTDSPPTGAGRYPTSRGWRVQEGADDSVAAAKLFDRSCRTGGRNTIYGVSMGGNTSGLVVADRPTRRDGTPLFDYWFAVEPAVNVTETYQEAALIAQSGNAFGVQATQDISQEMGGTPSQVPATYRSHTVVDRMADITRAGLRGVVVVQGVDDGLVPYNQSRELVAELHQHHIVTDDTTVVTRGNGETGTTLTGNVLDPLGLESPFAGHANEDSTTQLVGVTGFDQLTALYAGKGHAPTCQESVRDGDSGTWTTAPARC
jgi:hypothetical protein